MPFVIRDQATNKIVFKYYMPEGYQPKEGEEWVDGDPKLYYLPQQAKELREAAFAKESDGLYFKEQAGELPVGTWAATRNAIKARYPSTEDN